MSSIHDGEAVHGSPEQLARVDLNLLVAFDALARERSVTLAAQRVGVTQSALSHALRRLRELFADPLLVRGQRGMVLTPRAQALVVPLRSALITVGRALGEPDQFVPAASQRAFCMASPDLFDAVIVPALLTRLRSAAPAVALTIVPSSDRELPARLETGEVDVAVVPHVTRSRSAPTPPAGPGLVQRTLFHDRFVCLVRADHPLLRAKRTITLAQYSALPHILVAPRGAGLGPVDEALAARGLQRQIALRIPNFVSAVKIVAESDLVLTAPSSLATLADDDARVATHRPPLPLPEHSVNLLWHERFAHDPGHRWLRAQISDASGETQRRNAQRVAKGSA